MDPIFNAIRVCVPEPVVPIVIRFEIHSATEDEVKASVVGCMPPAEVRAVLASILTSLHGTGSVMREGLGQLRDALDEIEAGK